MNLLKKFFQHAFLICIIAYPIYKTLNYFQSLNPIEKELTDFKPNIQIKESPAS